MTPTLSSGFARILLLRSCLRHRHTVKVPSDILASQTLSSNSLTVATGIRSKSQSGGVMDEGLAHPFTWFFVAQGSETVTPSFDAIRRIEVLSSDKMNSGNRLVTVMSYNVLAQDLIMMHRNLYALHSPEALQWEHRKHLLLQEILMNNPDVLSLQEVQESHIGSFYSSLEFYGYIGVFKKRTSVGNTDGCAIYYKRSVFELLNHTTVEFNQPGIPVLNRPNVGIVLRLRHRATNRDVIVANTHLLYNPKRWDVRLAQTQVLLAELDRIVRTSSEQRPACLLMGDFNSQPMSPVVTLLTQGRFVAEKRILPDSLGITSSSRHKDRSKLYNSERLLTDEPNDDGACSSRATNEHCESSNVQSSEKKDPANMYRKDSDPENVLTHGFNFTSTYGFTDALRRMEATTFQDEWLTVDYIFYSQLHLVSRLRLPTTDECYAYIGRIPNHLSPSDHLPLVATYAL